VFLSAFLTLPHGCLQRRLSLSQRGLCGLALLFGLVIPTAAGSRLLRVSWLPHTIAVGSPCLFRVDITSSVESVRGEWMGHEITFFRSSETHAWYGLAGVDVEAKPGSYKLSLEATQANGTITRDEQTILVESGHYKTERLTVPEKFVQPDPETLKRIEAERKIKDAAFSHVIAQPEWSGKFVPPIDTTVSEGFGTRRTFNGKLASVHRGLDYHAKPGSPVMAANSGEVVLARELFYEGNCVIIDHGQQFYTLYMHLSHLEVSEGDKVEKGQQIGLSGATGRATGPHLHTAVRWQGAYLDPAQLWLLPLPALTPAAQSQAVSK
jgi:murein DD-endopeptidase MepM/ murein hydrolase activator NlpD